MITSCWYERSGLLVIMYCFVLLLPPVGMRGVDSLSQSTSGCSSEQVFMVNEMIPFRESENFETWNGPCPFLTPSPAAWPRIVITSEFALAPVYIINM